MLNNMSDKAREVSVEHVYVFMKRKVIREAKWRVGYNRQGKKERRTGGNIITNHLIKTWSSQLRQ